MRWMTSPSIAWNFHQKFSTDNWRDHECEPKLSFSDTTFVVRLKEKHQQSQESKKKHFSSHQFVFVEIFFFRNLRSCVLFSFSISLVHVICFSAFFRRRFSPKERIIWSKRNESENLKFSFTQFKLFNFESELESSTRVPRRKPSSLLDAVQMSDGYDRVRCQMISVSEDFFSHFFRDEKEKLPHEKQLRENSWKSK